jgi:hypothetical protein
LSLVAAGAASLAGSVAITYILSRPLCGDGPERSTPRAFSLYYRHKTHMFKNEPGAN